MGFTPPRRCRSMFSTITIASSTTSPTESTMARSVRRLIVKPAICMRNTAPMSEIGMATTGMITARKEPRKRKITSTTMRSVSVRVFKTSRMALSMYSVESYGIPTFIPGGSCAWMPGTASRTRRMTSSVFAVGSTQTPMKVAPTPSNRTSCS